MSSEKARQRLEQETVQEGEIPTITIPDGTILNADTLLDTAESVASSASVDDFTAPKSDINHGHDTKKHDVRKKFNVRDEFVSQFFSDYGVVPNDHAAVWLLSYRKDEFIEADEDIFTDTHDRDEQRWERIDAMRSSAPIPPKTQAQLKP